MSMLMLLSIINYFYHLTASVTNLPCYSEQDGLGEEVNCTAYRHINCTDTYLSFHYGDLYHQRYWPAKPHDLELMPLQEEYNHSNRFLPGFLAISKPPRSGSIQDVKGFQIDYDDGTTNKCLVIIINNTTLDHTHRDNNLKILVKIWPLKNRTKFKFRSWSLPKPPLDETDAYLVRDGMTGEYGWSLTSATTDWITTISYYNNIKENYIKIWFAKAPVEYRFTKYVITLRRTDSDPLAYLNNDGNVESVIIEETSYTFLNVKPGSYKVTVQPHDELWDSLDGCLCKTKENTCQPCAITTTPDIFIPNGNGSIMISTAGQDKTGPTTKATNSTEGTGDQHILPSILGFLAFIMVVTIIIGCYKLRMEDGNFIPCWKMKELQSSETQQNNHSCVSQLQTQTSREPLRKESNQHEQINVDDNKSLTSIYSAFTLQGEMFYPPCGDETSIGNISNIHQQIHDLNMRNRCYNGQTSLVTLCIDSENQPINYIMDRDFNTNGHQWESVELGDELSNVYRRNTYEKQADNLDGVSV